MPAALREHQHEISSIDGATALVFGTLDTGYLTLVRPVHNSASQSNTDQPRPQEDGTVFGRDYRGSKTVTFEIGVITDALSVGATDVHASNLDYLNSMEGFWMNEVWRSDPRAMAILRSCEAGRTSRAYGRPRKYDETAGVETQQGYTPVTCDFQLIDDRWYADIEQTVDINLLPAPDGGIVAPIKTPITTKLSTSNRITANVGGSRSTWPVVEFHGPVANPELTIGDLTIGLDMTLATGDVIVVDTTPWARTVLRQSDGAGFAGRLSHKTPVMRKCLMAPGSHALAYKGTDSTGTSYVRLRWRDARARP